MKKRQKGILELKNTVPFMKNSLNGLKIRMGMTEKKKNQEKE